MVDLAEIEQQKHQKDLQRLRKLRPIDDDFMRCLFKDNIPLAELVLRIITGKPDLIITKGYEAFGRGAFDLPGRLWYRYQREEI